MNSRGVLGTHASAEVSIGEDEWGHKGPDVEEEADPAGADLDPHSRPLAGHALEVCVRAVPVGQGHHDVEGGREEHEVEHGVAVLHPFSLVVHSPPGPPILLVTGAIGSCISEDHAVTSRQGQLIYLAIGGIAEARIQRERTKTISPIKFSRLRKGPLCDGGAGVGTAAVAFPGGANVGEVMRVMMLNRPGLQD